MLIKHDCLDQEDSSSDQSRQSPVPRTLHDGMHSTAPLHRARLASLERAVWKSAVENDGIGAVDVRDADERLVELIVRTVLEELALIFWIRVICFAVSIRDLLNDLGNSIPSHPHSEYS